MLLNVNLLNSEQIKNVTGVQAHQYLIYIYIPDIHIHTTDMHTHRRNPISTVQLTIV